MKLRYLYAGMAIAIFGIALSLEAPLLSQVFLRKTVVVEVPRLDFRLHVERVWKDDTVRMEFQVAGEVDDINLHVERVHFYVAPRQEGGVPARIFTKNLYGPSMVEGSEVFVFDIDVEGHLNIMLDNTGSSHPKTVRIKTVFEKSTNMALATLIMRNISFLGGGVLILFGIMDNYEEIASRLGRKGY